eukprot:g50925.t1
MQVYHETDEACLSQLLCAESVRPHVILGSYYCKRQDSDGSELGDLRTGRSCWPDNIHIVLHFTIRDHQKPPQNVAVGQNRIARCVHTQER